MTSLGGGLGPQLRHTRVGLTMSAYVPEYPEIVTNTTTTATVAQNATPGLLRSGITLELGTENGDFISRRIGRHEHQ